MTVTDNNELIINIDGKTQCITREQIEIALEYKKYIENLFKNYEHIKVSKNNQRLLFSGINQKSSINTCANYERDNVEQEKTEGTGDKIVDKVIGSFKQRSKFGQEKYNTTLENNNLGLKQWCQHIQEELMDAVNYLEKVKSIL